MFIGIVGSLFFFILFERIYRKNKFCSLLSDLGKYTLGIYVSHGLIISLAYKYILKDINNIDMWLYYFLEVMFALFIYFVCIVLIKIVHKNKYIEMIFFGSSYQNK